MGNANNICCEQTVPKKDQKPQIPKDQVVITNIPIITNQKILERIKKFEQLPLSTINSNHPETKELPPVQLTSKQAIYIGNWANQKPEGLGKVYFKNGEYFQGQFYQGIAHGTGRYIFESGDYYQGEIKANFAKGKGKYICNEFQFDGQWQDSKPVQGTYSFINEKKVILNSATKGQIYWADNRIYSGQINNFQPHGQGKMNFANGETYEGNFENGIIKGHGVYTWLDKSLYTGNFENGLRSGKGKLEYANGFIYDGQWVNGKKSGHGKVIKNEEILYEGPFQNGQPVIISTLESQITPQSKLSNKGVQSEMKMKQNKQDINKKQQEIVELNPVNNPNNQNNNPQNVPQNVPPNIPPKNENQNMNNNNGVNTATPNENEQKKNSSELKNPENHNKQNSAVLQNEKKNNDQQKETPLQQGHRI